MKKIKYDVYNTAVVYSFHKDMLKNNLLLYELCKIFALSNVYIDIYSVDNHKKNFCELLETRCKNVLFATSGIQRCQDIHLKVSINEISSIAEILRDFYFEDINIWDCYTEWEQYLKDKNTYYSIPIFKKAKIESTGLFYLNYKEKNVEIICDSSYYCKNLKEELSKLL